MQCDQKTFMPQSLEGLAASRNQQKKQRLQEVMGKKVDGQELTILKTRLSKNILINPSNECWEWKRALHRPKIKSNLMYPYIRVRGFKVVAHRLSYMIYVGPISAGLFVCHRCDNPKCCNPNHLFLGTQVDNMRDCISKGRSNIRRSKNKGEDNFNAVLNRQLVLKIRQEWVPRKVTAKMLAEKYNVPLTPVQTALTGTTWK